MLALDLLGRMTDNMMHKRYETREDFYQQLCISLFAVLIDSFIAKPSSNFLSSALPRSDRSHELISFNGSFGNGKATTSQPAGIAAALVSLIIDFLQMIEINNADNRSANDNRQMRTKV
ncbi:MAG TPA: hypothetical protein VI698_00140 [Nitrososphaerales archaeon]|nr:hypothetical protein [Nitrososphaerales archaeon]